MSKTQAIYYRNEVDIVSLEGIEVEAGSLWELKPDSEILILVDEDQYVSAPLDEQSCSQV